MRRFLLVLIPTILTACGPGRGPSEETPGAAAPPAAPEAVLELRRWQEPREVVGIGLGGVNLGPASEVPSLTLFARRERPDDLRAFVRTYRPFSSRTAEGEIVFRGRGAVQAGPLERRMLAEWAREVAAEAVTVHDASTYGLALTWRRAGAAGSCDEVAVFLSGEVRGSSCSWGSEIRGRLDPSELGRLYGWTDGLGSFQSGSEDIVPIGSVQSRLIFAGKGKRKPAPEQEADLAAFAQALHRELAARWPGQAATPPAEATPPPTTRLLLPPEATGRTGGPRPARLEIPAEPPPPPIDKEEEVLKPTVRRPQSPHPPTPSPEHSLPPSPGEGEEDPASSIPPPGAAPPDGFRR